MSVNVVYCMLVHAYRQIVCNYLSVNCIAVYCMLVYMHIGRLHVGRLHCILHVDRLMHVGRDITIHAYRLTAMSACKLTRDNSMLILTQITPHTCVCMCPPCVYTVRHCLRRVLGWLHDLATYMYSCKRWAYMYATYQHGVASLTWPIGYVHVAVSGGRIIMYATYQHACMWGCTST